MNLIIFSYCLLKYLIFCCSHWSWSKFQCHIKYFLRFSSNELLSDIILFVSLLFNLFCSLVLLSYCLPLLVLPGPEIELIMSPNSQTIVSCPKPGTWSSKLDFILSCLLLTCIHSHFSFLLLQQLFFHFSFFINSSYMVFAFMLGLPRRPSRPSMFIDFFNHLISQCLVFLL